MSIQQLLQQFLQSGQGLAGSATDAIGKKASGSSLGGFGGGAVAGGVLGLLLGNKKFRKMGGKVATYGGAAALGAVALKAYQDWQSGKAAPSQAGQAVSGAAPAALPASPPPLALNAPQAEEHSRLILSAMIAAAKADGHIGSQERQLLESEVSRLAGETGDRQWFEAELQKPADPAQVAAMAASPEAAAEIYLASVLVVDDESFMERAYLDELARRLNLEPSLKARLEDQVRAMG